MTLEIRHSSHERIETVQRFNICEILICRGDNSPFTPSLHSSFNIFVKQNKTSPLDEADRKEKGRTMPEIVLNLFQKCCFCIISEKCVFHFNLPRFLFLHSDSRCNHHYCIMLSSNIENVCFPFLMQQKKTVVSATLVTFTTVFTVSEGWGFELKKHLK